MADINNMLLIYMISILTGKSVFDVYDVNAYLLQ